RPQRYELHALPFGADFPGLIGRTHQHRHLATHPGQARAQMFGMRLDAALHVGKTAQAEHHDLERTLPVHQYTAIKSPASLDQLYSASSKARPPRPISAASVGLPSNCMTLWLIVAKSFGSATKPVLPSITRPR